MNAIVDPVYLSVCHFNSVLETLNRLRVAYIPKERLPSLVNKDYPIYLTMTGEQGVVYLSYGDHYSKRRYKFPSIGGGTDDSSRQG